jgi:hypothetical protein
VTEWKQNCHPVLPIVRSCVILQYDNVIGQQDPLGVAAGLAWPACFERGRDDSDVSAQAASARHRRWRVPTAVPTSPVSRLVGATSDDDHSRLLTRYSA